MDLLTAKALREERAPLAHQIKKLADVANNEKRDFNAEEQGQWDSLNKAYDEFSGAIERAERAEKVLAEQEAPAEQQGEHRQLPGRHDVGRPVPLAEQEERGQENRGNAPSAEDEALSMQAWLRCGMDMDISERHRLACKRYGINPRSKEFTFNFRSSDRSARKECRDLSAASGTAGAYTIPEGFVANLERAMLFYGNVRAVASVMRTTGGEPMAWSTMNDTGNTGARIAENTAVTEADPTFAQVIFYAYKYTSKLVQVPFELLQDSAFDLASELGSALGERLGRITNTEFTTGTGTNQPNGIVTASTAGKTTASATAVTFDEMIDLIHSVDIAYRNQPGAGFMFHDGILQAIRKLKDGNNNYLWQPSVVAGVPDKIWNFPYAINNDMQSSLATGTKTMLFGALGKYKIRDVAGVRLLRLNERYADSDQVGFVAFSRHDGNLLNAGVQPVKHMLQA